MAAVPAVGGFDLGSLAEAYRQQVTSGAGTDGASGVGGLGGLLGATRSADPAAAARGADFAGAVRDSLASLEALDRTAQAKAVQAATGDLTDVHDYVIAATEAQTATELTTTIRNKALEAFNEVMRMSL